jgi:hypothetical protein
MVAVGEGVMVGINVGVEVIGSSKAPTGALARIEKKAIAAAMMTTTSSAPTAAGKLNVITGIRLACTAFSAFLTTRGSGRALNSAPHTRQRAAFSLSRVPQVGHTFVLLGDDSMLIRIKIIPLNNCGIFQIIQVVASSKRAPLSQ